MVITDSYHNDIEGKDYKYGSPNKVDDKSKPIILFYFLEDYERVWDEGKPIKYDDEELKNNASVSLIDYTDNVLLINLFDYESFDEMELKFQVGKETSIPDVVDENNHSKEYRFTPTKIVVANSLGKDSAVYDEIVTSVWDGYYKTASKEGEKLPKVAENVKNAESYKKCAECSDSVFGLEEEICFECSSFGAETFAVDVIHRKDGIEVGDNSMANEYQCGECDSVYDNSSDATICCKCPSCDEPIHEGDCIKYAESFNADVKMDENAFVVVSVLIKQHRPISREYLHDILITKEDAKKTSPLKFIKEYIDSEAEYSTSSDLDVPEYWIFERNALAQIKSTRQMMAETGEDYEDCEVCYTTVDKGTLNDVQAGRICNECHRMNQYDAESFNALDMDKVNQQHYKDMIALLESQNDLSEMDKVKLHHYKDMLKMNTNKIGAEKSGYGMICNCGNTSGWIVHSVPSQEQAPEGFFNTIYHIECPSCREYVITYQRNDSPKSPFKMNAETFDVEFNEWADQELMSHGKDISFKDWAQDEGMKHGNTEITEWAQHEDESHDARFNAEIPKELDCKDEPYEHSTELNNKAIYDLQNLHDWSNTDDMGIQYCYNCGQYALTTTSTRIMSDEEYQELRHGYAAEGKKRSGLLSEPFEGTSLDSGEWKGILTGFSIGLLGLFGYSKLRK